MVDCQIHGKSSGYLDPDDQQYKCWRCYGENGYYNYRGKIVQTYDKVSPFILRMIVVGAHEVHIEGWKLDTKGNYQRIGHPYSDQYLSSASRRWRDIVRELDSTRQLRM